MTAKRTDPKRCSKCEAIKPRSEFHANHKNSDGLTNSCKRCVAVDNKRAIAQRKAAIPRHRAASELPQWLTSGSANVPGVGYRAQWLEIRA